MKHHRAIFISDVHLGSQISQAEKLLQFLKENTCDHLYIVGDFLDMIAMRRKVHLPQSHLDCLHHIVKLSRNGTRVTYILGNHDSCFRNFIPFFFEDILVCDQIIHLTADGKRILLMHCDQFDNAFFSNQIVMQIGDFLYEKLMSLNCLVNSARSQLGLPYWSLSQYAKSKIKRAGAFIAKFENEVSDYIVAHGANGILAGHIHKAEIKKINENTTYYNCGDWVESCSAITEDCDGHMSIHKFHSH